MSQHGGRTDASTKNDKQYTNRIALSRTRRSEEGKFWLLNPPGRNGPPDVPSTGLNHSQFMTLFRMPLAEFIAKYKKYFNAMYKIMVEDGVAENRANAIRKGFIPMNVDQILAYLREQIDYF